MSVPKQTLSVAAPWMKCHTPSNSVELQIIAISPE